jgi:hypothetical protein
MKNIKLSRLFFIVAVSVAVTSCNKSSNTEILLVELVGKSTTKKVVFNTIQNSRSKKPHLDWCL